ncbi:MAG: hypothetical protein GY730_05255 [bacterium]|nr:hypothetical protein [bacterium]
MIISDHKGHYYMQFMESQGLTLSCETGGVHLPESYNESIEKIDYNLYKMQMTNENTILFLHSGLFIKIINNIEQITDIKFFV